MRARRGRGAALLLATAALLGACADRSAPDPGKQMTSAAERVVRMEARQHAAPGSLSDEEVITLGYQERLRLGLGSPFRLMDQALQDPRLSRGARAAAVWALLRATAEDEGYAVDPGVLAAVGTDSLTRTPAAAEMHLRLIRRAVRKSGDPRVGETAVRLAYQMAAAEHAVAPGAPFFATSAAALARDGELASHDALRLLAHAEETGRHPFPLIAGWRAARRLEVEAPTAAPRSAAVETAAAELAGPLLDEVRHIAAGLRAGDPVPRPGPARSGLAPAVARRLSEITRSRNPAPHAPVRITLDRYRPELLRDAERTGSRGEMDRFLRNAWTEESFAAEHALLAAVAGPDRALLARVAVEAAVALRPFAQERVWHPGFPAPTAAELTQRFGIARVEFDPEVPPGWHPFYRHVLGEALADLRQVLPGLDLHGARFRFGRTGKEGAAVAIHDPFGRVVVLPPETGPGAIAHEVAHDLDWQAALRRYGRRTAYATELAVRYGLSDRFAAAARRLPESPVPSLRADTAAQRRYARRPAETFARSVDGFVVSTLAQRGRSSGFLSSAQDDFLGGYGLSLLHDTSGMSAEALLPLLDVASPVPASTRQEHLRIRGPGRLPTAHDLLVGVVGGESRRPLSRSRAVGPPPMREVAERGAAVRGEIERAVQERDEVLRSWAGARCAQPLPAHGAVEDRAARRLIAAAADARVRGIVLRHARALGLAEAPDWLRQEWTRADGPSPVDEGGRREWWEGTGSTDLTEAPCAAPRTEG